MAFAGSAAAVGAGASKEQKTDRLDPEYERLLWIGGKFPGLTKEMFASLEAIKQAFTAAGEVMLMELKLHGTYDKDRAIHTLDLLQQAKDTAFAALALPQAHTDPRAAQLRRSIEDGVITKKRKLEPTPAPAPAPAPAPTPAFGPPVGPSGWSRDYGCPNHMCTESHPPGSCSQWS